MDLNTQKDEYLNDIDKNAKVFSDDEIDLVDMAQMILHHWKMLVIVFVVGALCFLSYSNFMVKPKYQSTAKLFIVSTTGDSMVDLSALNIGTVLTLDYQELIVSYPMLDKVIDKLGWDVTSDQIKGCISLDNPESTRILSITATCEDPKDAMDLANAVAEVAKDFVPDVMSTVAPNIAQKGRLEKAPISPNKKKYTMLGGIAFAFIYIIFLVIRYLRDDSIRSREDLEKYFGIVPLTVIAECSQLDKK